MNFPRTSLFQILWVLGGTLYFYSNLDRTLCEQTVENLNRRRTGSALFALTLGVLWVKVIPLAECQQFANVTETPSTAPPPTLPQQQVVVVVVVEVI